MKKAPNRGPVGCLRLPLEGQIIFARASEKNSFKKQTMIADAKKEKRRTKFGFLRLGHVGDREVGILYLSEWLSVLTVDIMLLLLLLLLSSPSEKLGHEFGRILKGAV